jgi:hypothetical protein
LKRNIKGYAAQQAPQSFLLARCKRSAENALHIAGNPKPHAIHVFGVNAHHFLETPELWRSWVNVKTLRV